MTKSFQGIAPRLVAFTAAHALSLFSLSGCDKPASNPLPTSAPSNAGLSKSKEIRNAAWMQEHVVKPTVFITFLSPTNHARSGMGVHLQDPRSSAQLILTAAHTFLGTLTTEDMDIPDRLWTVPINFGSVDKEAGISGIGTLVAIDSRPTMDLALIEIKSLKAPYGAENHSPIKGVQLLPDPLIQEEIVVGREVAILSGAKRDEIVPQFGHITCVKLDRPQSSFFTLDTKVFLGNSGEAVISRQSGYVIGIVLKSGVDEENRAITLCREPEALNKFVNESLTGLKSKVQDRNQYPRLNPKVLNP